MSKNKCLICNEDRYIEKCHIIPRGFDIYLKRSGYYQDNLLLLCPTHHKLFDKGLLNEEEFNKIKEKIYITVKWTIKSIINFSIKIDNNLDKMNLGFKDKFEENIKKDLEKSLNKKVDREWLISLINEN